MSNTQLYRHWDEDNNLLYVGISYSSVSRLRQHEKTARWFTLVRNVTIEQFPTRKEAELAELTAIRTEKPIYNIAGVLPIVVAGKPVKKLRWQRPKYKIKGKRFFNPEYMVEYFELLDKLTVGRWEYPCDFKATTIRYFSELLQLKQARHIAVVVNAPRYRSKGYFHNSRVIVGYTCPVDGLCTTFTVNLNILPLLIAARDFGDPFLQKEYVVTAGGETSYITAAWYLSKEMHLEGGLVYLEDLVGQTQ